LTAIVSYLKRFIKLDNQVIDFFVIGGGVAGYTAAVRAAGLGARVVLVEKGLVGGTCLNVGCIPTKALLESVRMLRAARRAQEYGISVGGVDVSRPVMANRAQSITSVLRKGVEDLLKRSGVRVIRGHARLMSRDRVEVTSGAGREDLNAKAVLLATGSRWIDLPGIEIDGERIITSDHALTLEAAADALTIIGGGAIGCEMADIYGALGVRVTIVEMMQQLLPGEDIDLCRRLEASLKRKGVRIMTGVRALGVEVDGRTVKLSVEDGRTVDGELILMAVGRQPDAQGLGLEDVGVAMAGRAIVTDDRMRTSVPGVFAAGDVTGKYMLAHVAAAEGIVAAENAAGLESAMDYGAVPRCIYTDPEYAAVGLTEAQASMQGLEPGVQNLRLGEIGRALTMGETFGLAKMVYEKPTGRVLGFHALAPHASELVSEVGLAINSRVSVGALARVIHPHPTMSEAVMECARAAAFSARRSE
jgi:dihydrolipoamide dehydrogenase